LASSYKAYDRADAENKALDYRGLLALWTAWILGNDPDQHNNGNVVFLRGIDFPASPTSNVGEPMIGTLNIMDSQYILIPIITGTADSIDHNCPTPLQRNNFVTEEIDGGDDPPSSDQVLIDGQPISINLTDFRFASGDFVLDLETSALPSRTLRPYFDTPFLTDGPRPFVTAGYYVLIRFTRPKANCEDHTILFFARGKNTLDRGEYNAAGSYRITVCPSPVPKTVGFVSPTKSVAKNRLLLSLKKRQDSKDVSDDDFKLLDTELQKL
jgi:hypothetical protein